MFRRRRYRVFLLVAVLATALVYQLSYSGNWRLPNADSLRPERLKPGHSASSSPPLPLLPSSTPLPPTIAKPILPSPNLNSPTVNDIVIPSTQTSASISQPSLESRPVQSSDGLLAINPNGPEKFGQPGQGRLEVAPQDPSLPKPRWTAGPEHFPVPSASLIALPAGRPKTIPKIQYPFSGETTEAQANRRQRLRTIKEAFQHAWTGYSLSALPHDELTPVSAEYKDPFNGWGATLVDALDTLWIMGMKDEFEDAVKEVKNIDFTTSIRKDIPLFETTIRYLGGLISAYDLSSGAYPVLLDKAVELGDVLMGSFDTPNRMPLTYYHWSPSYASQPHRAETRVVLAELGSLSVEFTRLAQITKEPKYYDAIARITNALELWQNHTTLPGMWPHSVDASGCKKPDHSTEQPIRQPAQAVQLPRQEPEISLAEDPKQSTRSFGGDASKTDGMPNLSGPKRRQLDEVSLELKPTPRNAPKNPVPPSPVNKVDSPASTSTLRSHSFVEVDCEQQGLSSPRGSEDIYSIGGGADSTYEYLPKEYMLLGGLNEQYKSMYENTMNVVRDKLLFRPMTKDDRDILSVAKYIHRKDGVGTETSTQDHQPMVYEGSHLGCFAGGMFAIGAKIFGLPEDLDIARRLTDGCVWAYESTTTGIMPEVFELVPCDSLDSCSWNETKWWDALDPHRVKREQTARLIAEKAVAEAEAGRAAESPKKSLEDMSVLPETADDGTLPDLARNPRPDAMKPPTKRQASHSAMPGTQPEFPSDLPELPTGTNMATDGNDNRLPTRLFPVVIPLKAPLSHEEFVAARIREERLPPGYQSIKRREYILRPEAIESVFIMYRITGDEYWRERGWTMFIAIQSYTQTEFANSAILDVTSEAPMFSDTMESFWLAETLKYFYLLYSDPNVISLDEFVFNTEAHPFRRPESTLF